MKKYFLLFAAVIGVMMTSCSKDDNVIVEPEPTPIPTPEPEPTPTPEPEIVVTQAMIDSAMQVIIDNSTVSNFEITDHNRYSVEEMANLIFGEDGANGSEDFKDARKVFLDRCKDLADSVANNTGENGVSLSFDNYKFNYDTVDENGKSLTLSAWMCWPCIPFFKTPLEADHIVFVCPYTHTSAKECATESNGGVEAMTFCSSNLFIIPDGQGFGVNKGVAQTYLAHHLHAQQYYDCLVAADRIFRKKDGIYNTNWDLHVVGASQGGGDALSLHKYLETHEEEYDLSTLYNSGDATDKKIADQICNKANLAPGTKSINMKLMDKWRFAYSVVCCGPYSPEATLKEYLKLGKLSYPCVLPMVLKTMLALNPDLAAKYDETEFYTDLYNKHKEDIDKVLIEKTMVSLELNGYLRKLLALDNEPDGAPEEVPIDRILSPKMLDTESEMCKDMMAALAKENLTSGWTPQKKSHVYFCKEDEVVPYENSRLLLEFLGDMAVKKELNVSSHMNACLHFFTETW